MYIANSRVRRFRNYLLVINIYIFVHHSCSATCHILNVVAHLNDATTHYINNAL